MEIYLDRHGSLKEIYTKAGKLNLSKLPDSLKTKIKEYRNAGLNYDALLEEYEENYLEFKEQFLSNSTNKIDPSFDTVLPQSDPDFSTIQKVVVEQKRQSKSGLNWKRVQRYFGPKMHHYFLLILLSSMSGAISLLYAFEKSGQSDLKWLLVVVSVTEISLIVLASIPTLNKWILSICLAVWVTLAVLPDAHTTFEKWSKAAQIEMQISEKVALMNDRRGLSTARKNEQFTSKAAQNSSRAEALSVEVQALRAKQNESSVGVLIKAVIPLLLKLLIGVGVYAETMRYRKFN
jgi:hypothetical protein